MINVKKTRSLRSGEQDVPTLQLYEMVIFFGTCSAISHG